MMNECGVCKRQAFAYLTLSKGDICLECALEIKKFSMVEESL